MSSPKSEQALLTRALSIAGMSFADLAKECHVAVPANFKKQKGWTGQLVERALGASAGSKATQDFPELGIELKTLPLNYANSPIETTYVCYAHLTHLAGTTWANSSVRNKLQKVLWVPIQGEREIPIAERCIGTPFLWQPNEFQEQCLRQDWEEIMELITLGHVQNVTAKTGQYMQLRPKAANGKALTDAIGTDGTTIRTRPRGFYLRKNFTQQILTDAFG